MKKILIPGLILAVFMGLSYMLSIKQVLPQDGWALILLPVYFIVFFLLLKWVKTKFYSNIISFKELFTTGMFIGLFSAILVSGYVFIFLSYIDPSAMEILRKMTDEQKQKTIERLGSYPASAEKFANASLTPAIQAAYQLVNILFWILCALISAAILKTKKPQQILS